MNFSDALKADFFKDPLCYWRIGSQAYTTVVDQVSPGDARCHTHKSTNLVTPGSLLAASNSAASCGPHAHLGSPEVPGRGDPSGPGFSFSF